MIDWNLSVWNTPIKYLPLRHFENYLLIYKINDRKFKRELTEKEIAKKENAENENKEIILITGKDWRELNRIGREMKNNHDRAMKGYW